VEKLNGNPADAHPCHNSRLGQGSKTTLS
jgi:hypothetical protein